MLTKDEIATLTANETIRESQTAPILILEFADVNCYYCQRQIAIERTVQTVMEQFPGTIKSIFKHMPVLDSYEEAQIIECFGEQSDATTYHQFLEQTFATADGNIETLYTLAEEFGKDSEKIRSCVNNETFINKIERQRTEGENFEISGTPSSVIINTRTGEYVIVAGAYPVEAFIEALKEIL